MGSDFSLVGALVKVALTFALLFVTLRLVGRFGGGRRVVRSGASSGRPMDVVAQSPLGRGASVVLLRVGRRFLALGVTEQRISLLAEVEDEAVPVTVASPLPPRPVAALDPAARTQSRSPVPARTSFLDALRERTVRR